MITFEQLPESKSGAIAAAGVEEFSKCAYADANTERITAACGISKGLLYHYFGTKKEFYLYCLRRCLETLTKTDALLPEGDFYGILFAGMERKMTLCAEHPAETRLLNMASRECAMEIREEKDRLLKQYAGRIRAASEETMRTAISTLRLKSADEQFAAQALSIYANALVQQYLLRYQNAPEEFFAQKGAIMKELKAYLDLMLYGICEEEK